MTPKYDMAALPSAILATSLVIRVKEFSKLMHWVQGWNLVKKILPNKFSRFLKSDLSIKVFQIFSSSYQAKPKFNKVKIIPGEQIQIVEQIEYHG